MKKSYSMSVKYPSLLFMSTLIDSHTVKVTEKKHCLCALLSQIKQTWLSVTQKYNVYDLTHYSQVLHIEAYDLFQGVKFKTQISYPDISWECKADWPFNPHTNCTRRTYLQTKYTPNFNHFVFCFVLCAFFKPMQAKAYVTIWLHIYVYL